MFVTRAVRVLARAWCRASPSPARVADQNANAAPQGPSYVIPDFNIFVCTICSGQQYVVVHAPVACPALPCWSAPPSRC